MNKSYWVESTPKTNYPNISNALDSDVLIIGGGITGILTAYMLSESDLNISIVEADKMAMGVTANTTAKITSQHGLLYDYLLNTFGFETAKGYLDSNEEAITTIKNIIQKENINCDLISQDAYVYTCDKSNTQKIVDEVSSVTSLGLKAEYVTKAPLPFPIEAAIKFPNQAQFNAYKYVAELAKICKKGQTKIYENSKSVREQYNSQPFHCRDTRCQYPKRFLALPP